MPSDMVRNWFGARFAELHPMLQRIHTDGGTLNGTIQVTYGTGVAGAIGRRLGRKMGVPGAGAHTLRVDISHHADGLHWDRTFDNAGVMASVFRPVGTFENGYWAETTGPLEMRLTVDIVDGGWHWRALGMRVMGVALPVWLFPASRAYKTIEDGRYRFFVGFSAPVIGELLSYNGLLDTE